jgi:regulator of replication initiation timing
MLIRISLILAIIVALGAGTLNILQVRDKISTLVSQRDDERGKKQQALSDLSKAKTDLTKSQETLKQTTQDLADAKSEREKAVATATAQTKRADELSDKLAKTTQERDDAQTQLAAYKATGMSADQVGKLSRALKDSQEAVAAITEENVVLQRAKTRLQTRLDMYEGTNNFVVKLRANLRGKILVVDPKWDFVVLNIGQDQGVLENGELLVSREGKLVAKVIVRSLEKNRCIANVVPGWKLGEVIEGDEVSPAHPAS